MAARCRALDWSATPLGPVDGARVRSSARRDRGDDRARAPIHDRERHAALERERLLEIAEQARAEAEAANRSKSDFLAVMSHELRTPLNAIGGYTDLIELGLRGPVTAEQRIDLARIQQSQRHLLGLINEVLNYSRVEAGVVDYRINPVPVGEALELCEALTRPQMRARELTFVVDPCDPTLAASADREKMQQIILNLLTNAIVVRDTGRGIAPDDLMRVFEPFVQIDTRLTRENEGVGLGLAISRDLARGMGGDLMATSTVGRGSVFTLELPRH